MMTSLCGFNVNAKSVSNSSSSDESPISLLATSGGTSTVYPANITQFVPGSNKSFTYYFNHSDALDYLLSLQNSYSTAIASSSSSFVSICLGVAIGATVTIATAELILPVALGATTAGVLLQDFTQTVGKWSTQSRLEWQSKLINQVSTCYKRLYVNQGLYVTFNAKTGVYTVNPQIRYR